MIAPGERVDPNARGHWRVKAAQVKAWRKAAAWTAAAATTERVGWRALVTVEFAVPDRRRRDPSNWGPTCKAIVDGLTDAGWWPDDTPDHVTVAEPILRLDPASPGRVRICAQPAPTTPNPFDTTTSAPTPHRVGRGTAGHGAARRGAASHGGAGR